MARHGGHGRSRLDGRIATHVKTQRRVLVISILDGKKMWNQTILVTEVPARLPLKSA